MAIEGMLDIYGRYVKYKLIYIYIYIYCVSYYYIKKLKYDVL